MTVWEDKKCMRKYMVSGAHVQAMKATKEIADLNNTKTYGYFSDHIPTWQEAIELWEEHGTLYGKYPAKKVETKVDMPPPPVATSQ